jgi:hypothetical protein
MMAYYEFIYLAGYLKDILPGGCNPDTSMLQQVIQLDPLNASRRHWTGWEAVRSQVSTIRVSSKPFKLGP